MPKKRDPNLPKFVNVRVAREPAKVLWQLLAERPEVASISHKAMPTYEEHVDFVEHHPYRVWHLIKVRDEYVGAAYMTRRWEVGIAILNDHQGMGYGKWAVKELVRRWGSRIAARPSVTRKAVLANIAPENERSAAMFRSIGFKHVMNVYALDIE